MVVYIDIVIDQAMTISFVHYLYFIKCKMFIHNSISNTDIGLLYTSRLCYPILLLKQICTTLTIISFPYCLGTFPEYYKIKIIYFINKFFVEISFKSKYKHLLFNLENVNYYFLPYH